MSGVIHSCFHHGPSFYTRCLLRKPTTAKLEAFRLLIHLVSSVIGKSHARKFHDNLCQDGRYRYGTRKRGGGA